MTKPTKSNRGKQLNMKEAVSFWRKITQNIEKQSSDMARVAHLANFNLFFLPRGLPDAVADAVELGKQ